MTENLISKPDDYHDPEGIPKIVRDMIARQNQKYTELMLDLETLGVALPDSAIVAIGAVRFNLEDNDTYETLTEDRCFYSVINLEDSVKCGFKMDAGTVKWWLNQSDGARRIFNMDANTLELSLRSFQRFIQPELEGIWGNGSSFDNVLLDEAFKKVLNLRAWSFRANRDLRTLKALAEKEAWKYRHKINPTVSLGEGHVAHNAVNDAMKQVLLAQRYQRILNGPILPLDIVS